MLLHLPAILWEGSFYLREREHRQPRTIRYFFLVERHSTQPQQEAKGVSFQFIHYLCWIRHLKFLSMSVFIYFRISVSNKNYRLDMSTERFVTMGITTVSSNMQSYIPWACNFCRNNKTVDFVRIYNRQIFFWLNRVVWLINIHHNSIAYLQYPSVESLEVSKMKRKQTIQLAILHPNTQNIIQKHLFYAVFLSSIATVIN